MKSHFKTTFRIRECYFCKKRIEEPDFRDAVLLSHYLTSWGRIRPAKDTGTCAKHQRRLARAIKRARTMALLAYTTH